MKQRFTGTNLLIEYFMSNRSVTDIYSGELKSQNFIYLENTETGRSYNIHDTFYDDIYHTGDNLIFFRIYQDHFIIFREASDLSEMFQCKSP